MIGREETIETYNSNATALARYYDAVGSRAADIDRAISLLGKASPKVVEIGCGNGRDAAEILKRTNNYVGMDVSAPMIDLARANNPGVEFVVADIRDFQIPSKTDLIFAFASLLHSDQAEIKQFLDSSKDSLIVGGIIYLSLKSGTKYEKFIKKDEFGRRLFYIYTPALIQELAGSDFVREYLDYQTIGLADWFTVALRKIV